MAQSRPPASPRFPERSWLLEGDFPVEYLAEFARREGRRPRPIYLAHKWFARRLGSVFRALLVGANWAVDDDFWLGYYGKADLSGLSVLDPFVGGGTSVVEAQRLGASVLGVDVDPIACEVTRFELQSSATPDLADALALLKKRVGSVVSPYHELAGGSDKILTVLHHFWVQFAICSACEREFDVQPNYWLARSEAASWGICSHCDEVHELESDTERLRCTTCGKDTHLASGTTKYGRVTCPHCGHREKLIEMGRRECVPPRFRLLAQEVLEEPCGGRPVPISKRRFVTVGEDAHLKFSRAADRLKDLLAEHPDALPREEIPTQGQQDNRLVDYGYRTWVDLFNPRQRLHLALLASEITKLEEPMRRALSIAFSNHLTTNCMLTAYAAGWRRLTPLFGVRAFRHVPRPVELNPWLDGTGRGTFPNAVNRITRARAFALRPKEPLFSGGFTEVKPRRAQKAPVVRCGTARELSFLADASVDFVLTDPPYFDNIAYSDLAHFYAPWMEALALLTESSHDRATLDSFLAQRGDADSIECYTTRLREAVGEICRVLRKGGLFVFSFRHRIAEAWLALATAFHPHPLVCKRVIPVPGEIGNGLHAHPGTGLWDAVFVLCREGGIRPHSPAPTATDESLDQAIADAMEWKERLKDCPIRFGKADFRTLAWARVVQASLSSASLGGTELSIILNLVEDRCAAT